MSEDTVDRMTDRHAHGQPMARLGWDDDWGVNGVLPGGGRCAACHTMDVPDNYLLCKPCWARLPAWAKADLTDLWHQIARRKAGTIAEIRARQTMAVDAIEHVPSSFCPHCPIDEQDGAEIFRRLRPDACVST